MLMIISSMNGKMFVYDKKQYEFHSTPSWTSLPCESMTVKSTVTTMHAWLSSCLHKISLILTLLDFIALFPRVSYVGRDLIEATVNTISYLFLEVMVALKRAVCVVGLQTQLILTLLRSSWGGVLPGYLATHHPGQW